MDSIDLRYNEKDYWDVIIKWSKIKSFEQGESIAKDYTEMIIKEHGIPVDLDEFYISNYTVRLNLKKNDSNMSDIEFSNAVATFDKIFS